MELAKTYKIITDRLVIRCYEPGDAPKLQEAIAASVEHLRPWMPWAKEEPSNLESKIKWVRQCRGQFDLGQDYTFAIFDKTEQALLGSIGLHTRLEGNAREIGYWIHADHLNKGYAQEAVNAVTKVGFEIEKLSRIEIHCDKNNTRSQHVPEKVGYTLETVRMTKMPDVKGNPIEQMIWTIQRQAYAKSSAKGISLQAFDMMGRKL